jgi:hypothetical protein
MRKESTSYPADVRLSRVMKYCPVCSATYDEEIIRFCTKDGTPLIDGTAPVFTEMPSESSEPPAADDFGEDTVIRRKPVVESSDTQPIGYDEHGRSERIVIPTEHQNVPQQVRPRPTQGYVQPPPPSNTTRTVVLTILGTLAVLGLGAAIFWGLQKDEPRDTNININGNQSTNLNTNLAFDSNFNFNSSTPSNLNGNSNVSSIGNFNTNASTRPSPVSSPRPSPTPSPIRTVLPTPSDEIETRPTPSSTRSTTNSNTSPVGTPRIGPRPPPIGNRTPPPDNSNR